MKVLTSAVNEDNEPKHLHIEILYFGQLILKTGVNNFHNVHQGLSTSYEGKLFPEHF